MALNCLKGAVGGMHVCVRGVCVVDFVHSRYSKTRLLTPAERRV